MRVFRAVLGTCVQHSYDAVLGMSSSEACVAATVTAVSPANGPTSGGFQLTISGVSFGGGGSVILSTSPAAVCSNVVWTSTRILCNVPPITPALFFGGHVNITVRCFVYHVALTFLAQIKRNDNVNGSSAAFFRFDAPILSSLNPNTVSTAGGTLVQIVGGNFGQNSAAAGGVRAVISVDGRPVQLQLGSPNQPSQTSLWFKAPINTGRGHTVWVSLSGQRSNTLLLNYSAPSALSVSPASVSTQGGTPLTVSGSNLGVNGSATVTVGGLQCNGVTARSDGSLQCTAPVGAGTVPVVVTIAGQSGQTTWSYAGLSLCVFWLTSFAVAPSISYVTGCTNVYPQTINCVSQLINIFGSNFGNALTINGVSLTVTVLVNGAHLPCNGLSMVALHTQLSCTLPAAIGVNLTLTVSRGSQSGSLNAISYAVCPCLVRVQ